MDNPETQETYVTRHRTPPNTAKITTQKTKKVNNIDPTKKPWMNSGACEKQALPVSHKKSTILLKIDKSLVSDRLTEERKNLYQTENAHWHLVCK